MSTHSKRLKEIEKDLSVLRARLMTLNKLASSSTNYVHIQLADSSQFPFDSYSIKFSVETDEIRDEKIVEMNNNEPCDLNPIHSKNSNIIVNIAKKSEAVEEEQKEIPITRESIAVSNLLEVSPDQVNESLATAPTTNFTVTDNQVNFEVSFRIVFVFSAQEAKKKIEKEMSRLTTEKSKLQLQSKAAKVEARMSQKQKKQEEPVGKSETSEIETQKDQVHQETKVETPSNLQIETSSNKKVGKKTVNPEKKIPSVKAEKKQTVESPETESSILSGISSKSAQLLKNCWEYRSLGLFAVGVFVVRAYGDNFVL